ncbi:hypothetical protein V2G26_007796 [Clonostachys chloroleuca]
MHDRVCRWSDEENATLWRKRYEGVDWDYCRAKLPGRTPVCCNRRLLELREKYVHKGLCALPGLDDLVSGKGWYGEPIERDYQKERRGLPGFHESVASSRPLPSKKPKLLCKKSSHNQLFWRKKRTQRIGMTSD